MPELQGRNSVYRGVRLLKRLGVKVRHDREAVCDTATILTIQRLLAEPLMSDKPPIECYSWPGGTVDCQALLAIQSDGAFVEAAFRQVLGREITDRVRRKWLQRLRWVSRAGMLLRLRYTTGGKVHAARIPGLWHALFSRPTRHGGLRLPFVDHRKAS